MDSLLAKQQFELMSDRWIFRAGLNQYPQSRRVENQCTAFVPDDEDEQIDDEPRSCYNCQYRRWMMGSFECLALQQDDKP